MKQLFVNNAKSTLQAALDYTTTTTLTVTDGSKFPSPAANEYFLLTLEYQGQLEIVRITSRSMGVLTIEARGQEGTTPQYFPAGTVAEVRITKGTLEAFTKSFAPIVSITDILPPALADSNGYICDTPDPRGNPLLVIRKSDTQWRSLNYTETYTGTIGSGTTTSINATATHGLNFALHKYIIQFANGYLRKVTAATSSSISWAEPLSPAVTSGTFSVWTANSSLLTELNSAAAISTTSIVGISSNNVQLVLAELMGMKANSNSPTFTGVPSLPIGAVGVTQAAETSNTTIATTQFVHYLTDILYTAINNDPAFASTMSNALALKANLISPTFTGTPSTPDSPVPAVVLTQIANTKFVEDSIAAAGVGVPVGSIVAFAGDPTSPSPIPDGFLECDGSMHYADALPLGLEPLFNVIGETFYKTGPHVSGGRPVFYLPDLRGEFIRGWSNGTSVDAGRLFGTNQVDDLKDHAHSYNSGNLLYGYADAGPRNAVISLSSTNTGTFGGTETRPRNVALTYCIKF